MGTFFKNISAVLVLLVLIVFCEEISGISVATNPPSLIVSEGQTATLGCTVESKSQRQKLRWYRVVSGEIEPISRDRDIEAGISPATGEYRITGDRRRGEYNLEITNTNRSDSGEYQCGYRQGGTDVASASVHLEVVGLQDISSPMCRMTAAADATSSVPGFFKVGDAVRLECTTTRSMRPASLGWRRGAMVLIQDVPERASVDHVIRRADIGQEFTCYAESDAWRGEKLCSLIPAATPPQVRIMPELVSLPLEGGTTFACSTDNDVPPESRYKWFLNGEEILDNGRGRFDFSPDTRSLRLGRIRASDDGAVLVCELRLRDGVLGRAEATIDVIGVERTTLADMTTTQPTTMRASSGPLSPTVPLSVSPSGEVTNLPGTGDTTHMSTELIIVTAVAGLAIGALVLVIIVVLIRRHRRKAKRQTRNQLESTSPVVLPTKQPLGTPDGVRISEDGYTTLRKPNMSSSDYETVGYAHGAYPSAPTLKQGDDELCWDYEIPYSHGQPKRPPVVVAENPVYLEIIE